MLVAIGSLTPHPQNPRRGNIPELRKSLETHQQYKPIVFQKSSRHVITGNHIFQAARELGWTEIDANEWDVDDAEALRILLIDNRSYELGSWDAGELVDLLDSLPSLDGTGFTPLDLPDLDLPEPDHMPAGGEVRVQVGTWTFVVPRSEWEPWEAAVVAEAGGGHDGAVEVLQRRLGF